MSTFVELTEKFRSVWPLLDERTRRLMAANEAMAFGHGGVSLVHRASGLSRKAIRKGIQEIRAGSTPGPGRVRRSGAGRKPVTVSNPQFVDALEALIDEQTRGDPESPLRWTCMSTRTIARELDRQDHPSVTPKSHRSFMVSTTVCKAIARPRKGKDIPTGMRNSDISVPPSSDI